MNQCTLGFSVLELFNLSMYEYFYDKLLDCWGNMLQLHYMDTNSFILRIKTEDRKI